MVLPSASTVARPEEQVFMASAKLGVPAAEPWPRREALSCCRDKQERKVMNRLRDKQEEEQSISAKD